MELVFGYIAGLLTLINPCVLPVLPIILATSLTADRRGPLALALGMSIAFVAFGMFITVFGRAIGLSAEKLSSIGAIVMIIFGLILLIPPLSRFFENALSGFAQSADSQIDGIQATGFRGQFFGGVLLGAVWSPCIGPTLGGAIALASQGESLLWAFLIMVAFALGVSTIILGLGWGGQRFIGARAGKLRGLAEKSKPIMGLVFLAVGLMIYTKFHYVLEAWALDNLPYWLTDLSVAF